MADPPQEIKYRSVDDFFRTAQPSRVADEVRAEIVQERLQMLVDQDAVRQQEDWSFLAQKVVGAEGA